MNYNVTLNEGDIVEGVKKAASEFPVKTICLFGSYANGNYTEASDIDLLVEFLDENISLFMLSSLRLRIEEILGKNVDLIHAPIPDDAIIDIGETKQIYEA